MEPVTIIISVAAITISIFSAYFSYTFSRINILNTLQDLMLRKAAECNKFWEEAIRASFDPNTTNSVFERPVQEIFISIKLLDSCLEQYSLKRKRDFLIQQFWAQLTFRLRAFLKDSTSEDKVKMLAASLTAFQKEFPHLKAVLF